MELTKRQAEAIRFIRHFTDENGFSPTVREVQAGIGHASVSSTHHVLLGLKEMGVVEWNPTSPRTMRLRV